MRLVWTRAPRAALTSPVTVVVGAVAGLVVAFVAAISVLHVSASGSAAVQHVVDVRCPDDTGVTTERAAAEPLPVAAVTAERAAIAEAGRRHGLHTALRSRYAAKGALRFDGAFVDARFVALDGAQQHISPIRGGGLDGAWVSADFADSTGADVGDSLVVRHGGRISEPTGSATVPITAVYPTIKDPVDERWCSQRGELVRLIESPTIRPSPVLVSNEVMDRLAGQGLVVEIDRVTVFGDTPSTVDDAAATRAAAAATAAEIRSIESPELDDEWQGLVVRDRAAYIAASGERALRSVGTSVLPLAGVSLLIGLAGVGGLALMWAQRRSGEVRLLWTRGVSPVAVGGKAALELAGPLLVGAVAGWGVARLGVRWLTPRPEVDPWAPWVAAVAAGAAWIACVAVLAAVVTVRVRRVFQPAPARDGRVASAARIARRVPWEFGVAALAAWSWLRLADGALIASRDDLLPRVDMVALMFPLLVLVVLLGVGSRLVALGLRLGHRARGWRAPLVLWAARRAAAQARLTVGLLAVAGLAVGVVAVGVGMSGTERQAVVDKGRMFIGSDTSVRLTQRLPGRHAAPDLTLPPALRGTSTHGAYAGMLVGKDDVRVLVVDPATAADGLPWREPWSQGVDLAELVSRLGPTHDGALPAIVVRSDTTWTTDPQTLTPDGFDRLDVVATVDRFPGVGQSDVMIVVSWDGFLAAGDVRGLTRVVFSRAPADVVTRELEVAGVPTAVAYTAVGANDALPFLVVAWTFDFFVTLGVVLAAMALTALLLAIEARRRATAVAHGLLARMGLRTRGLFGSYVVELAAVALAAAGLGLLGGWSLLAGAATRFDPAPWLTPAPTPVSLAPLASLVLGIAAAAVAVVAAGAAWSAARASVRDLLRAAAE